VYREETRAIAIGLVRLIADELALKEIAALTHLSLKTVHYHWTNARKILGVRNPVGAVKLGIKEGWVEL
jgi:DNA-binding CsgD family transcriptional regulator